MQWSSPMHNEWKTGAGRLLSWGERIKEGRRGWERVRGGHLREDDAKSPPSPCQGTLGPRALPLFSPPFHFTHIQQSFTQPPTVLKEMTCGGRLHSKGWQCCVPLELIFPIPAGYNIRNASLSWKGSKLFRTPSSQSKEAALCISCFSHLVSYSCHLIYSRDNTDYCVPCWTGLSKVAVLLGCSVVPSRSMIEYY